VPATGAAAATFSGASLLFYGIQAAGPTLTPESFRDGFVELAPDATVTTEPYISFGDHGLWAGTDYNGIDDLAEILWGPEATGPDELDRATARACIATSTAAATTCPDTPPAMFDPGGAVAIIDELPTSEAVPDSPDLSER
jgi:hypothetical protein